MYYLIDQNSNWQLLPWHKINARVVLIQRKIFEASRQYDLTQMYQLQSYLINSHEGRLSAINYIACSIKEYYNYESYIYDNLDKFSIFKYLFDKSKFIKAKLRFIIEKIKEYLIYLCLQAEWQARSVCNLNRLKKNPSYNIITNSNDSLYILLNLKTLPYINIYIKYWIRNHYIFHITKSHFNYLYNLLINISQLNFRWYKIKLRKASYCQDLSLNTLIKYNDVTDYSIVNSSLNATNVLCRIKARIYRKDLLNKYRLKSYLPWKLIIQIIIQEVNKICCNDLTAFNLMSIFCILNQANYLMSYLKFGKYQKFDYFSLYYMEFNLYSILCRKKTSIFLYFNLFKITR